MWRGGEEEEKEALRPIRADTGWGRGGAQGPARRGPGHTQTQSRHSDRAGCAAGRRTGSGKPEVLTQHRRHGVSPPRRSRRSGPFTLHQP